MSTQHKNSTTHQYIKGAGAGDGKETLLRAKPQAAAGVFEIWRGAKIIARVRRENQDLVITWGQCNKESALDAIYIHQLEEAARQREAKERRQAAAQTQAIDAQRIRPVAIPQVIVTLGPAGQLQVELPAVSGRRVVQLGKGKNCEFTLRTILEEQRNGNIAIGQDGAPTRQQVFHWENHQDFPNPRCVHCLAEGRIKGAPKRQQRKEIISKSKDVEIRRIKTGASQKDKGQSPVLAATNKRAEDLGL